MSQKTIKTLFAILVAGGLALSARAQSNLVYAVEFNQANNRFGTIDLWNGNFTQIATIGGNLINDLAYCPTNGVLYGILNSSTLVTFDKTNGAMTSIAPFSVGGIQSLAFRSDDGVLFGATQTGLYIINPATGDATLVGSFGSPANLNNLGQNIRFAQDGNLYVSNTGLNTDVYRISTTNGSATWMGEAVGIPYLMLMNGDNYMYGVYISLGSSDPRPKLMSFDLTSFVDGGTNADGSTHQISIAVVGPGTNFPINFIFSGSVFQPVTNLTVAVGAVGPSNQTVCPGSTVVFSIVASGTGPYSYTWLKDDSIISGETGSSLTLTNVGDSDAATYSVIVGGEIGSVTNSATLTMNVPAAASSLSDLVCWLGGSATFSTVASGTGPFSYTWLKDGVVISGQNSDSLTLNNVSMSDEATYSVVVSGACGSVTNSATLTIHRGSGDITITVIPALAPNANNSPNWNDWVSNAVTAILNGYSSCGDPSLPSCYQQVTDAISVTNNLVSVFPSWNSLADPGTAFGANFAGETGNRLHFGFDIKGGSNFISIAQLSFVAHSTDTNNTLDVSYPAGSYTYSPSCVGIIYGPGGTNICITSGSATQWVNEIIGRGSGNAWWAATNGMPDLTSEQSNLNVRASQICSQPFVFVGTYTLAGVSGLGQVTFTPALTNAPPLQIDSPMLSITLATSGPDSVKVGWSAAAGDFVLQTNIDLLTANWGDYHGKVDTIGLANSATIDTPTRCLFFRLKH